MFGIPVYSRTNVFVERIVDEIVERIRVDVVMVKRRTFTVKQFGEDARSGRGTLRRSHKDARRHNSLYEFRIICNTVSESLRNRFLHSIKDLLFQRVRTQ